MSFEMNVHECTCKCNQRFDKVPNLLKKNCIADSSLRQIALADSSLCQNAGDLIEILKH